MFGKHKNFFIVFGLSFSSGLPFLLLVSTLSAWLSESFISKTTIGLFSLATLPYALKFLWAPFIDQCSLPVLTRVLGRRRSWLLLSQVALMLSLLGLGNTDPNKTIGLMGLFALFKTFICFIAIYYFFQ